MSVVALIRPDSWNFPLFLHVLGAMILVGGLPRGRGHARLRQGEARFLRLGYWTLLAVSLPGWVLMRIGAGWISSKEGWDDLPDELVPTWLTIGFFVADLGGLILLVSRSWAASACTAYGRGAPACSGRRWCSRSCSWRRTWSPRGRWPASRTKAATNW